MKTIMADFILWRVWLYLLETIGEPGHSAAMTVIDDCMSQVLDEAFVGVENTDCGVAAMEQLRIARELAHWQQNVGVL